MARVSIPSAPTGLRPTPTNHTARKPNLAPSARKAGAVAKASAGRSGRKANQCQGLLTIAALSPRRHLPIRADRPRDGSQIGAEFGVGGAAPKPVPVVGAVDFQIRIER